TPRREATRGGPARAAAGRGRSQHEETIMPGDRISKTELDVDGRKLVKVPSVKGLIDIGKANVKFILQLQVKGGAVDPPTQKNVEGVIDKMLDEFGRKINDELEELVKQVRKKQEDEKRGDDKAADEAMSLVEKTPASRTSRTTSAMTCAKRWRRSGRPWPPEVRHSSCMTP
ncbi:MAG: hypothetical protein KJZ68_13115, partial [Phycisphaerales bacterium]|nr:hypothetical protein [Phycisphaerales bacterium]